MGGVGGGGYAWTGTRKTLLFMARRWRGGGQVRAVGGVGHGLGALKTFHGRGVKHCFSWQGRCGEGGVGGVGGESGEGGGGWAWTGACKTLLFMAGALEGGRQVRAVGAVRAVRAVWAVRAAGVGMDWSP